MSIIMSSDPDEIIRILKKAGEHVFKVTKEIIYAIHPEMVSHYKDHKDFLKFANEHPKEVFTNYYYVIETVKEIEEL